MKFSVFVFKYEATSKKSSAFTFAAVRTVTLVFVGCNFLPLVMCLFVIAGCMMTLLCEVTWTAAG